MRWIVAAALMVAIATGPARAACDAALLAALWPDREAFSCSADALSGRCAAIPAPGGAHFVAVVDGEDLLFGLVRCGTPLARGSTEPLSFESPWSPHVEAALETRLGPGREAWRVTYSNSYLSTGRSTGTEAVHIVLRRGQALDLVFAGLVRANHSAQVPCRHRSAVPCRSGWSRRWRIEAAGPARSGRPPDLVVRNAATGAVVSRHRWRGEGYVPPVFDRTPPVGPT